MCNFGKTTLTISNVRPQEKDSAIDFVAEGPRGGEIEISERQCWSCGTKIYFYKRPRRKWQALTPGASKRGSQVVCQGCKL